MFIAKTTTTKWKQSSLNTNTHTHPPKNETNTSSIYISLVLTHFPIHNNLNLHRDTNTRHEIRSTHTNRKLYSMDALLVVALQQVACTLVSLPALRPPPITTIPINPSILIHSHTHTHTQTMEKGRRLLGPTHNLHTLASRVGPLIETRETQRGRERVI